MKLFKRLMAVMFALTLTLGMGTRVYAEGETTTTGGYTITITQNSDDKGTHTYGAYQIFKGDLAEDGTLSNIQWGSGITDAGKTALGDAKEYAKSLTVANAAEKAVELAAYLATPEKTGSDKIEGLEGGYYLVQDTTEPTGDPSAKTKYILRVVENVTVTVKSSVPSVEKKVQDINDSAETVALTNLQDSADYDIGDSIPYTITATIGSGIGNFTSYSVQFVDEMSKGLTLDQNSWDIKADGTSIKDSFTLSSASGTNEATIWTWAATDIKPAITEGSKVVLTYNATLNANAVVGSAGNPNEVYLKFDNNPNNSGKGTPEGETPKDKNIVFTYKTVFNKVDQDKNPLTGADFKLEKKVNGEWVDVTALHGEEGAANPTKTTNDAGTVFTFTGLDDGDYKLTETVTPSSYNTIEPIEFTITAAHDVVSDNPALTALTGTDGQEFTMTPKLDEGSLSADVVNQQGSTLPSTGGIGTTIFYVIGGLLVAGAGIVLVARKKASE